MKEGYETHKYAEMFPDMASDEFAELVKDIRINGLVEPITMLDGKVLDGRSRLRACIEAGVEPKFAEFAGRQDPLEFVWTRNFARRHLTLNQRVAVALKFKEMLAAASKKRMSKGGRISAAARNGRGAPDLAPLPEEEKGKTVEKLAEMARVGRGTMQSALEVQRDAPELLDAIAKDELSVHAAAKKAREKKGKRSAPSPDRLWKKVLTACERLNADISCFETSGGSPELDDLSVLRVTSDRLLAFLNSFEKGDGA
jgi:ParB-like chromosome segregation protein Spo0J